MQNPIRNHSIKKNEYTAFFRHFTRKNKLLFAFPKLEALPNIEWVACGDINGSLRLYIGVYRAFSQREEESIAMVFKMK